MMLYFQELDSPQYHLFAVVVAAQHHLAKKAVGVIYDEVILSGVGVPSVPSSAASCFSQSVGAAGAKSVSLKMSLLNG